jgi:hypothetical protein
MFSSAYLVFNFHLLFNILQPLLYVFEGDSISHIKDDHHPMRPPVVIISDGLESVLAGSVPLSLHNYLYDLKFERFSLTLEDSCLLSLMQYSIQSRRQWCYRSSE